MTAGELYLPVPTISRDVNVLPAMTRLSSMIDPRLATAHEVDDFDAIAVVNDRVRVCRTLEHGEIVLDRDAARINLEPAEQFDHRQRTADLDRVAVERNLQTEFDFNA